MPPGCGLRGLWDRFSNPLLILSGGSNGDLAAKLTAEGLFRGQRESRWRNGGGKPYESALRTLRERL